MASAAWRPTPPRIGAFATIGTNTLAGITWDSDAPMT